MNNLGLDFRAMQPSDRPLYFASTTSARYFVDCFAGHVFEIRLEREIWCATIRRDELIACRTCYLLEQAHDWLQAEARRLAGGAA